MNRIKVSGFTVNGGTLKIMERSEEEDRKRSRFMRLFRIFFPVRAMCDFKGIHYESHWANRVCKKIPKIIDEPLTINLVKYPRWGKKKGV